MKRKRRNTNLQIVRNTEDATDAVIDQVLTELKEEDGLVDIKAMNEQVKKYKHKQRMKRLVLCVVCAIAVAAIFAVIQMQTYSVGRITATYDNDNSGNNSYLHFGNGVLKYSRDGIAFVDRKGEEQWNQAYQMKAPVISVYYDQAIVVADKGGNDMVVLNEDGELGEIHTNLPIKRVCIAGNGIVCAMLGDDSAPKLECFDATGNPLIEITTSLTGTGYPLNMSLSEDGKMLLVPYMYIENDELVTKVIYYDFSMKKESAKEYEATVDRYEDMAAAEAFFLNKEESVVVGDDRLLFYRIDGTPKLATTVTLNKKIKMVFHDEKYVGLVLKNAGKAGYELCLFNAEGKKLMSQEFTGDYSNAKICKGQVILYDGKKCLVYAKNGLEKFNGEMSNPILEMFPVIGVNKYVVMTPNGMDVIRFVK